MALGKGVMRNTCLLHPREQIGLDPQAFAYDGIDRFEVHQLLIAVKARTPSERPVELAQKRENSIFLS